MNPSIAQHHTSRVGAARLAMALVALIAPAAAAQTVYYEVWRNTADDPTTALAVQRWLTFDAGVSPTWDDADVLPGQTYYYWIRAIEAEELVSTPIWEDTYHHKGIRLRLCAPTQAGPSSSFPLPVFRVQLELFNLYDGGDVHDIDVALYESEWPSDPTLIDAWVETVAFSDFMDEWEVRADTTKEVDIWQFQDPGSPPAEVYASFSWLGQTMPTDANIDVALQDPLPAGPQVTATETPEGVHLIWYEATQSTACGPADQATIPWPAEYIVLTAGTLIACDDTTYDGADVVIDGCTVTIDCEHAFNSLHIVNSAEVCHSPTQTQGLHLVVANDVVISSDSQLSADGAGYGPAAGPGAGQSIGGQTNGAGGGGHGGIGGRGSSSGGEGGTTYGSIVAPTELGSGGGNRTWSGGALGGAGGGAIRLTVAGALVVDGSVAADGPPRTNGAGGGSGGSVWITCGSLAGEGTISANGATCGQSYWANGGGGGGGRVAVYYNAEAFTGNVQAVGGAAVSPAKPGSAGTVFIKLASQSHGDLLVDNAGIAGSFTVITGSYAFDELRVEGRGQARFTNADVQVESFVVGDSGTILLESAMILSDVEVAAGGSIVADDEGIFDLTVTGDIEIAGALRTTAEQTLKLAALNDLVLASSGTISADACGFPSGQGPGAGGSASGEINGGGGGGYGGAGGNGNGTGGTGGATYGNEIAPMDLGSGGGSWRYGDGGAGGGAVRVSVAGAFHLEGVVSANGQDRSQGAGGGSGGSIWITCDALTGNGTVSANGGSHAKRVVLGGGGGGGRIAVYYNDMAGFGAGILAVDGGSGWQNGEAGTIHLVNGVDPNTEPQPDLIEVLGIPPVALLNEPFTAAVTARNLNGWAGPDSAINASVLYADDSHTLDIDGPFDAEWADHVFNYLPGEGTIFDPNGDPIGTAVDHLVEAVDMDWVAGEEHSMSFTVTPHAVGALWVRVRTTMRHGLSGGFFNDTTAAGGEVHFPDQNGWEVRQYAIDVQARVGDIDEDGDIDTDDFAVLANCLAGPGEPVAGGCDTADLDQDGDVDLGDFGVFQTAFGQ